MTPLQVTTLTSSIQTIPCMHASGRTNNIYCTPLPPLQACLFGVPISPWLMYLVVVTFSFTFLVLFQTDVYTVAKYI